MNTQQYPVEAVFPLSAGQQSIWIMNQLDSAQQLYNMQMVWQIPVDLNIKLLEQCLAYLQQRNAAWRTTFPLVDGKPVQQVHTNLPLDFSHIKLDAEQLQLQLDAEFRRPLDLTRQTSVRWCVFDVFEETNDSEMPQCSQRQISWFFHHIMTDKWSVVRTANELKILYAQALAGETLRLPALETDFAEFVTQQQAFMQSAAGAAQKAFWCEQLRDYKPQLDLPYDLTPANTHKSEAIQPSYLPFELDPEVNAKFQEFCRNENISLYSAYFSCAQLLLHRLTGACDISLASPTAGRDEHFAGIFNYFVNPILARARINPQQSAQEFLRHNHETIAACLANQHYPLAALMADIIKDRSYQRSNFSQAGFVWQNINRFENRDDPLESWPNLYERIWHMGALGEWQRQIRNLQIDEFDICFKFYKFSNGVYAGLEYNGALFSEALIACIANSFNTLLHSIVSDDQRIADLPLVHVEQQASCRLDTPLERSNADFVTEFEQCAQQKPQNIALTIQGKTHSYRQLNNAANQFAREISAHCKPGNVIGISLDKGFELYAGILGILKAGCAYVPLDVNYPHERLQHIISDSGLQLLVSCENNSLRLPPVSTSLLIEQLALDGNHDTANPSLPRQAQQCAYVIYTSGSTGKPKGVAISHDNWRVLIASQRQALNCSEQQRVLQFASLNFDASVFTMTWALANGATMVCADKLSLLGPALIDLCRDQRVSAGLLPPSLLQHYQPEDFPHWRDLIVGGEACAQSLVERWAPRLNFYNAYGPTECTVWASLAKLDANKPVSIGHAVAGASIVLLDASLQPVPRGIPGEIFIGGPGVGLGYCNNPQLSAERFPTLSLAAGEAQRFYRSGDLARINASGELEFLGRIDDQVKIRGYRIELGEISACCEQHPDIQCAYVTTISHGNSEHLVAYVVPEKASHSDASTEFCQDDYQTLSENLREHCRKNLPEFMVPGFIVALAELPLTPNDKIDKQALPKPILLSASNRQHNPAAHPPRNDVESVIAEVWCQVLEITSAARNVNFFDLGGHSLKVIEVFNALPASLQSCIKLVDLYQYTTIENLARHIINRQTSKASTDLQSATRTADATNVAMTENRRRSGARRASDDEIAIIGMAMRVPGANTPEDFWQNLLDGVGSISRFSREQLLEAGVIEELISKPYYVPAKGVIDNIDSFDAAFFSMSAREAQITDPQQRVFLECAWDALESAGYACDEQAASIGVYAGVGANRYYSHHIASHPTLEETVGEYPIQLGNNQDFLATRIAYKLHLNGPAMTVQTACSTSLVAVHTAAQALRKGECDVAIAGGVSLGNLARKGYLYIEGMIQSKDGYCRPFDDQANGTVVSEGAAVVLLKPMRKAIEDGDEIIATIKGSAINNDGAEKAGFTAPSPSGQQAVIEKALAYARISANQVGYVEAHGTATKLGDPIEVKGLTQAYQKYSSKVGYAYLGSVKSNIGHLDAAAGVTGFIKAALTVQSGNIPATLHYQNPNPNIDFENSPFRINNAPVEFPQLSERRYAGVSSFGLGGTNAHAIVAQATNEHLKKFAVNEDGDVLLTLSAMSTAALQENISNLLAYLEAHPDTNLNHLSYTTRLRRKSFAVRASFVGKDLDSLKHRLSHCQADQFTTANESKTVWLFPGQGSQYPGLCEQLSEKDPLFAADLAYCRQQLIAIAAARGRIISDEDLRGHSERLYQTEVTQAIVFIASYCLAKALQRAGLDADAMLGHSLGEYVAATLAGVLTLDEALHLVAIRGDLIASLEPGAMLALNCTLNTLAHIRLDFPELDVAAENSATQYVLSGASEAITNLEQALGDGKLDYLQDARIRCKRLKVSHAFHSRHLQPILAEFEQALRGFSLQKPQKPFVSSLTGQWISDAQAQSSDYWLKHLRHSVRFSTATETLLREGYTHFVEVGPGQILSALTQQQAADKNVRIATLPSLGDASSQHEWNNWLALLGKLWCLGAKPDWHALGIAKGHCIKLPTYAFQRERYWVEPVRGSVSLGVVATTGRADESASAATQIANSVNTGARLITDDYQGPEKRGVKKPLAEKSVQSIRDKVHYCWQEILGEQTRDEDASFFELGGSSLLAVQLSAMLNEQFGVSLTPASLIEFDTIKSLSCMIQDQLQREQKNQKFSSVSAVQVVRSPYLHCLKTGERRRSAAGFCKTLIMIHPISGEVYYFQDLAKHLPKNISFYALEAPSLSGKEAGIDSVEQLAERYLSIISKEFSPQSIVLGGASFGGLVALEIAARIARQSGYQIPLVLGDTPTPESIAAFVKSSNRGIFEYLGNNAFDLGELQFPPQFDFWSLDKQLGWFSERCHQANITLPDSFGKAMINTWMAHQSAMCNYQVPDYDGDVLYLRATTPMVDFPSKAANGWLNYLRGDLHFKSIPGTHISMNFGDNSKLMAENIERFIAHNSSNPEQQSAIKQV